jgi:hypothetical protein
MEFLMLKQRCLIEALKWCPADPEYTALNDELYSVAEKIADLWEIRTGRKPN